MHELISFLARSIVQIFIFFCMEENHLEVMKLLSLLISTLSSKIRCSILYLTLNSQALTAHLCTMALIGGGH
jgi:ABC-type arginine/histidine transport system permease subunit